MPDREKVVKGLECLITNEVPCDGCPYNEGTYCLRNIAKDALELLKVQKPVKPERRYVFEPDKRFDKYRCTACDDILLRYRQRYCGSCGRELKWDAVD